MKKFDSMEQRIIYMYIDLFPMFKPFESKEVSKLSQKQFYDFIESLFHNLYQNPLLLFSKINKDDFFVRRFNKKSENKEVSYAKMKKIVKVLEEFIIFLHNIGKIGCQKDGLFCIENTNKIPKKYIIILEQCNINYSKSDTQIILECKKYPELFNCWIWLSTSSEHTIHYFISCMFDKGHAYTKEIYTKLSNNKEIFESLVSFLIKENYRRVDNRNNRVNLDYIKEYDKKENVLKDAWGERTHGGISAEYDPLMQSPPLYSLRVPYYKTLLQQSDKMPNDVKEFVVNTGKKCDNCRYCIQMDKTGKKLFSFVFVEHNNKKYNMCTYFPGFNYCWEKLDKNIVNCIINTLTFIDKILNKK